MTEQAFMTVWNQTWKEKEAKKKQTRKKKEKKKMSQLPSPKMS